MIDVYYKIYYLLSFVFVFRYTDIKALSQFYQDAKVCTPSSSVVQVSYTNERDNQCAVWLM